MKIELAEKKYFINNLKRHLKNQNKILSAKYFPSIQEVFQDYIEIYEDYKKNQNDKLKKSIEDYIEVLKFNLKENFLRNSDLFKEEFTSLIDIANSDSKEKNKKLYISIKSLSKKMSKVNLYKIIIDLLYEENNFAKIDNIITLLVNELIYDGYSLKYLDSWLQDKIKKGFEESNIDEILEDIKKLNDGSQDFTCFIELHNVDNFLGETVRLKPYLVIKKVDIDSLEISPENKTVFKESPKFDVYKAVIEAKDQYKALEVLINEFNNHIQLLEYIAEKPLPNKLTGKMAIVKNGEGEFKLPFHKEDEIIMFSQIEEKEKEDIKRFIEYRNKTFNKGGFSGEIISIQRSLNILKNSKEQSEQNRLLNLWSTLEYTLTFHEGNSIIGKVKDVLPKLISMYYIKSRINTFWAAILKYEKRREEFNIIDEILKECSRGKDSKTYDLGKILNFIEKKDKALIEEFEFNDILKREIGEIGYFLSNKEYRKKRIELLSNQIENDLIRIYRTRNVLIHSGHSTKTNLNFKSLRLLKYASHLFGVIIYYKNKNHELTIEEILNSIVVSHEHYLKVIDNKKPNSDQLCKPKYYFL